MVKLILTILGEGHNLQHLPNAREDLQRYKTNEWENVLNVHKYYCLLDIWRKKYLLHCDRERETETSRGEGDGEDDAVIYYIDRKLEGLGGGGAPVTISGLLWRGGSAASRACHPSIAQYTSLRVN